MRTLAREAETSLPMSASSSVRMSAFRSSANVTTAPSAMSLVFESAQQLANAMGGPVIECYDVTYSQQPAQLRLPR